MGRRQVVNVHMLSFAHIMNHEATKPVRVTVFAQARECKPPSAPGEVFVKVLSDRGSTPLISTKEGIRLHGGFSFLAFVGVEPEGSRQSVGKATQSAFFIFGKITQNFIRVFAFLYTKKRKWMLTLDKNRVIAYDRRQDRGAKFISTLPLRSSFSRKPKGNIAEVKSSSCALFAGPSGKTRRTVTQVERYRVQDPSRGPG